MFSTWTRLYGVSRKPSTRGHRSFRATAPARWISVRAEPDARAPRVPALHGRTTVPVSRYEPEAMGASSSLSRWMATFPRAASPSPADATRSAAPVFSGPSSCRSTWLAPADTTKWMRSISRCAASRPRTCRVRSMPEAPETRRARRWGMVGILLWPGDPQAGAVRGPCDPGPDVRVGDAGVRDQLQQVHLDAVVEHDADRARLPAAPADPLNFRISIVEGPGPLLGNSGVPFGPDPLIQAESPGRHPDQIQHWDGQPGARDADPPSRSLVEDAQVTERFTHPAEQRGRRVPDGPVGAHRKGWDVVVEPHAGQRSVGTLPVPGSADGVIETDEPEAGLQLMKRRPGRQH